jgi:methylated-DNA-[protein]-cysteine S-methyltransferase
MMSKTEAKRRLERYGLTEFQKKVLLATLDIKEGHVSTYKEIAKRIGHKNSYRAVGTALRLNPLPIIIPCHRVIKSDGSLGFYSGGAEGTSRKRELLKSEGAIT